MDSPYDPDARFGNKRSTTWTGYKVHLTETCDTDAPRHMTVRPHMGHEALVRIRAKPETPEWKERYDQRAGIEGTLSPSAFG